MKLNVHKLTMAELDRMANDDLLEVQNPQLLQKVLTEIDHRNSNTDADWLNRVVKWEMAQAEIQREDDEARQRFLDAAMADDDSYMDHDEHFIYD